MQRVQRFLPFLGVVGLLVAGAAPAIAADIGCGGSSISNPAPVASHAAWAEALEVPVCRADESADRVLLDDGAMHAHRDPATGRFTAPPASERAVLPGELAVARRPLVERRVEVPGGGVRVDLGTRFATALVVTRVPDGVLSVDCGEAPAEPPAPGDTAPAGGER